MCKCGFLKIGCCVWSWEGKRWPISQNKILGLYINHSRRGKWRCRSLWWTKHRAAMWAGGIIPDTAVSAPLDLPEKKLRVQSRTDLIWVAFPPDGIPCFCLLKGLDCILLCNLFLSLSGMYFYSLLDYALPYFLLSFSFIIPLDL